MSERTVTWLDDAACNGLDTNLFHPNFQCAFFTAVAMSPPVLHAIADLLTKVTAGGDQ